MKINWKQMTIAGIMGLLLPCVILLVIAGDKRELQEQGFSITDTSLPVLETNSDDSIMIPVQMLDGTISNMDLEEYLVGVVLAEMPVSFAPEAHKAQAVVARTYTLRRLNMKPKHESGAVCTNPACCQAYLSDADFLNKGGTEEEIEKIRNEVAQTKGEVLEYDGRLIDATYFSCSGGKTENALAVWGTDIPYLQSTESPGEENASHYEDEIYFTREEFSKKLGIELWEDSDSWFGDISYTDGDGVALIEICDIPYKGTTVRQLLGLRSTAFKLTADPAGIRVTTKGYGHRVGMSQYGAEAMANAGIDYKEILAHYYLETDLKLYCPEHI